jgi:hypothetical protein
MNAPCSGDGVVMLGKLRAGSRGIVVRSSTGTFFSYPKRPDRVRWAPSVGIMETEHEADH